LQFLLTLNEDRTWTISAHSPKPSANSPPSYAEWQFFFANVLSQHTDLGGADRLSSLLAKDTVALLAQRG
jgi:hypothetical protein